MLSRDVHATAQVPWRSSGWNGDRNVRMMLECLLASGEVAINGREATSGCGTSPSVSTRRPRAGAA